MDRRGVSMESGLRDRNNLKAMLRDAKPIAESQLSPVLGTGKI